MGIIGNVKNSILSKGGKMMIKLNTNDYTIQYYFQNIISASRNRN